MEQNHLSLSGSNEGNLAIEPDSGKCFFGTLLAYYKSTKIEGGLKMGGYNGKLIRVDLSKGTIKVENLDMEMAGKYIGGRGIGTKILADEVNPKVDALSPENKLIFMTGPLSGTNTPTGGRYMVITKSPLTGTVACSNSGGYWGAELKFAGYDGIIFEGKSEKPVYLNIENEKIEHNKHDIEFKIENTYVPVRAVLGKTIINVSEFLDLQVGDVIPLETSVDGDLDVLIGDLPKFHAKPGVKKNKVAVKITEVIRREED